MAASIAIADELSKSGSDELVSGKQSNIEISTVAATFVERGKTDKYGWMNSLDDLADYLGRLS